MTAAIEAHGLVKTYGKKDELVTALAGIDLVAEQGTVLGVLGPNGAGKTTAVRVLSTLVRPDSGTAVVDGFDVVKEPAKVRRRIGLTGQYASVDENLTGRENVVMIGRLLDLTRSQAQQRAKELLAEFDLSEAAERPAKTYSGGMRRRLDLAASLVGRPSVIYLDEPTTGLDPAKRDDVWRLVRALVSEGTTVLLTTQYLEEADALADHIAVIDHGKVVATDTPHALKLRIGGQSLEVRPADPSRLDEVEALLARVCGTRPDSPARGALRVPVASDAALPTVVDGLAAAGIAVTELALRLPSLDEVFHSLTRQETLV